MSFQGTEFKVGDVVHFNDAGKEAYKFSPISLKSLDAGVAVTGVARADEWYVLYRPDEGVYFKYIEHMGGPW